MRSRDYFLCQLRELKSCVTLFNDYLSPGGEYDIKRMVVYIIWLMINFAVIDKMIKVKLSNKEETRYGTVASWMVFSVFSFGIAGAIFLILDANMANFRIAVRRRNSIMTVLAPTITAVGIYELSFNHLIRYAVPMERAIVIGILVAVAMMFLAIVLPTNKPLYVTFPYKEELIEDMKPFALSKQKVFELLRKHEVVHSINGTKYRLRRVPFEELQECLLLEEIEGVVNIRKYQRANGNLLKVAEIGSLTWPRLYDSLAGLLVLIMVTTPYFPMIVPMILNVINL